MPPEFANFHTTVSSLAFDEAPDYNALRGPFETLLERFTDDKNFDWKVMR
jgi:hypothetical protein